MPHDLPILKDLIILLLVSVPIAFIGSRLRLPGIVGFMIVGVLTGFGLIEGVRAIEVLSESEYSRQIVSDVLPFRDVFNSVFFISIGMLLSVRFVAANLLIVSGWVVALGVVKALVLLLVMRLLRFNLRVSTMTAVGLAQVGEFSFVIAKTGMAQGLLTDSDYQKFLAAAILSMIATPFLIQAAPRLGYRIQRAFAPGSLLKPHRPITSRRASRYAGIPS